MLSCLFLACPLVQDGPESAGFPLGQSSPGVAVDLASIDAAGIDVAKNLARQFLAWFLKQRVVDAVQGLWNGGELHLVPRRADPPVVAASIGHSLIARQAQVRLAMVMPSSTAGLNHAETAGIGVHEEIVPVDSPAGSAPEADLAAHHMRVGADVMHEVLPDMELNGGVAVDPLADLRVDLVPGPADIGAQIPAQRGEVFVEVLSIDKVPSGMQRVEMDDFPPSFLRAMLEDAKLKPNQRAAIALQLHGLQGSDLVNARSS